MRNKMGVIKCKMGTIGSKWVENLSRKEKTKWVEKKKINFDEGLLQGHYVGGNESS